MAVIFAFLKSTLGTCIKIRHSWVCSNWTLTDPRSPFNWTDWWTYLPSGIWKSTDYSLASPKTLWLSYLKQEPSTPVIPWLQAPRGHDPCVMQPSHKSLHPSYGYYHTKAFATPAYKCGAMITWIQALEELNIAIKQAFCCTVFFGEKHIISFSLKYPPPCKRIIWLTLINS